MLKEDVNSHWTVKGPEDKAWCQRGEPVECGQTIRLEHLTTHRNLHSHHFTNMQEVQYLVWGNLSFVLPEVEISKF